MARQVSVGTAKNEFKLCPVGRHVARVVKAEYRKTDSGDKELNEVTFRVLEGPATDCTVREAFWLTSDKTYERYDLFCAALGIKPGTTVDPNDPHDALVGRTIAVKVAHKDHEYKGETRTDAILSGFVGWDAVDKAKYPDVPAGEKGGHANPDPTGGGTTAAQDDDSSDDLPF